MTSEVKVIAHCASNKEVVVEVEPAGEVDVLQDGEVGSKYVYDDRSVRVYERVKKVDIS